MSTIADDRAAESRNGSDGREDIKLLRNETELERTDRNLVELLQEVRVAQTGVQVLFGFLLAIVFQNRFRSISEFQRIDYFVTLLAAGGAAILLIAPTAYHRILFRRGDKEYLVKVANRFTVCGLAAVAVAMVGVMMLITDFVFGSALTAVITAFAAGGCFVAWFVLPMARRRTLSRREVAAASQRPIRPAVVHGSAPPRSGSHGPTPP